MPDWIEKNNQCKIIHQTPWFADGVFAGPDSEVVMVPARGPATNAATRDALAALWSRGGALRVAVKKADSIAAIEDGKSTLITPRSDETACTALAFDARGKAVMLYVGLRSTVLYLETASGLGEPALVEPTDFGLATDARKHCGLALDGDIVHYAWSDASPTPAADDEGMPTDIHYRAFDRASGSFALKSRHDALKSVLNIIR